MLTDIFIDSLVELIAVKQNPNEVFSRIQRSIYVIKPIEIFDLQMLDMV